MIDLVFESSRSSVGALFRVIFFKVSKNTAVKYFRALKGGQSELKQCPLNFPSANV